MARGIFIYINTTSRNNFFPKRWSHDETDTLMILHAAELGAAGKTVHLMTQETDALVLALRMSFYYLVLIGNTIMCPMVRVSVDDKCCSNPSTAN